MQLYRWATSQKFCLNIVSISQVIHSCRPFADPLVRVTYPSASIELLEPYQCDPAARSALLAFLSVDQEHRLGGVNTVDSAPYEVDVIRRIRARLSQTPGSNSAEAILAIVTMSQFVVGLHPPKAAVDTTNGGERRDASSS